MGYMIVAVTKDNEHLYIYHGKDKQGVPILYGFLNTKNTKVYPRVFGNYSQAVDVADGIANYLSNSMFSALKSEVWEEEDVKNYLETKYK